MSAGDDKHRDQLLEEALLQEAWGGPLPQKVTWARSRTATPLWYNPLWYNAGKGPQPRAFLPPAGKGPLDEGGLKPEGHDDEVPRAEIRASVKHEPRQSPGPWVLRLLGLGDGPTGRVKVEGDEHAPDDDDDLTGRVKIEDDDLTRLVEDNDTEYEAAGADSPSAGSEEERSGNEGDRERHGSREAITLDDMSLDELEAVPLDDMSVDELIKLHQLLAKRLYRLLEKGTKAKSARHIDRSRPRRRLFGRPPHDRS